LTSGYEAAREQDPRPPILFLRSFRDDRVRARRRERTIASTLLSPGGRPRSIDEALLDAASPYGPVVAIGNPEETTIPYGAARQSVSNEEWQMAITLLAREARCIVVAIDETEGVRWEEDMILREGLTHKAIVLVNPSLPEAARRTALSRQLGSEF